LLGAKIEMKIKSWFFPLHTTSAVSCGFIRISKHSRAEKYLMGHKSYSGQRASACGTPTVG